MKKSESEIQTTETLAEEVRAPPTDAAIAEKEVDKAITDSIEKIDKLLADKEKDIKSV